MSRPRGRLRKEGISLHGFEIGLLKILYFGNPTLLDKSIMERMIGVCSKVFVGCRNASTIQRYGNFQVPPGLREKSVSSGEPCGMLKAKGYGVFHTKEKLRMLG